MGLELDYILGQTPLDEEEKNGLLIPSISTRKELDEFEQKNIEQAIQWLMSKRFKVDTILSEEFIKSLHKRMFGEVWAWAGEFRKSNKNLGIDRWIISTELKNLLDDTLYWIENTTYPAEEIGIRFKHRLVSIHCFPNGNGRHSRLMADIIIEKIFYKPPYSWGAESDNKDNENRKHYIDAVQAADKNDYSLLLAFARS
jgi:Fic-DOC domain mobile mystery protein B